MVLDCTCGDGLRVANEECDDGNTMNGDGCSSDCKVETYWKCEGGSFLSPDTCLCDTSDSKIKLFVGSCQLIDEKTEESAAIASTAFKVASAAAVGGFLSAQLFSGATGSFLATILNSLGLMSLLKYCDVEFPPNVEKFFGILANNTDVLPNPFKYIPHEKQTSSYYRFGTFEDPVLFLDNAGGSLAMILISVAVVFCLKLLVFIFKKLKATTFTHYLSKILAVFEWDNTLSYFVGNQTDFFCAWMVQLSQPTYDTYGSINFALALFTAVTALVVCLLLCRIIHKHWNQKQVLEYSVTDTHNSNAQRYPKFNFLWGANHGESVFSRYFILFQIAKNGLMVAVIYFLPQAPFVQSYLLTLLSTTFFIMIAVQKPLTGMLQLAMLLLNEFLLALEGGILMIFAVNKRLGCLDFASAMNLGWALVGLIIGTLGLNTLLALISIPMSIRAAYCKKRQSDISRAKRQKRRIMLTTNSDNNRTETELLEIVRRRITTVTDSNT